MHFQHNMVVHMVVSGGFFCHVSWLFLADCWLEVSVSSQVHLSTGLSQCSSDLTTPEWMQIEGGENKRNRGRIYSIPFFGSIGVSTRGFTISRQAVYHSSHASSPLCSGYIWVRSLFCPGQPGPPSFYFMLPTVTEMIGAHHHAQLFSIELESHKDFYLRLV
jgi:hypothetical protein